MLDFELSFDNTSGPQSDPQDVSFCRHIVGGDDPTHVLEKTERERKLTYCISSMNNKKCSIIFYANQRERLNVCTHTNKVPVMSDFSTLSASEGRVVKVKQLYHRRRYA